MVWNVSLGPTEDLPCQCERQRFQTPFLICHCQKSLCFFIFFSFLEWFYVSQEYSWCPNIFFFCPDIFVLFWKFPEYLFSGSLDLKWRPPSGHSRFHINLGCFKLYHLLLPHTHTALHVFFFSDEENKSHFSKEDVLGTH